MTVILISGLLSACSPTTQANPPMLVGADRDAHGCIGSAGYSWCAREAACLRPWELAQAKGLANSSEAFTQYCSGTFQ